MRDCKTKSAYFMRLLLVTCSLNCISYKDSPLKDFFLRDLYEVICKLKGFVGNVPLELLVSQKKYLKCSGKKEYNTICRNLNTFAAFGLDVCNFKVNSRFTGSFLQIIKSLSYAYTNIPV